MRNFHPHQLVEVELAQLFKGKGDRSWKTPYSQRVFRKKMMIAIPETIFFQRALQACLLRKDPAETILP